MEQLGLVKVSADVYAVLAQEKLNQIPVWRQDGLKQEIDEYIKWYETTLKRRWFPKLFKPWTAQDVLNWYSKKHWWSMENYWEGSYKTTESRCKDVIRLCKASVDGFIWLSPEYVKTIQGDNYGIN